MDSSSTEEANVQTRDELRAECSHWHETAERLSARRDELERRVVELEKRIEELETEISNNFEAPF